MKKTHSLTLVALVLACRGHQVTPAIVPHSAPIPTQPICSDSPPTPAPAGTGSSRRIDFSRLDVTKFALSVPLSLCELTEERGPAGLYEVVALHQDVFDSTSPRTLADLRLEVPWTEDAPDSVQLSLTGGFTPSGLLQAWPFETSVGNRLGLILDISDSKEQVSFKPHAVWREVADSIFDNGQLGPIDVDELGAAIHDIEVRPDCPPELDIEPRAIEPPAPIGATAADPIEVKPLTTESADGGE